MTGLVVTFPANHNPIRRLALSA